VARGFRSTGQTSPIGKPLVGGTLTGPLTLSADPVALFEPTTKQYVDARIPPPTLADANVTQVGVGSTVEATMNEMLLGADVMVVGRAYRYRVSGSLNRVAASSLTLRLYAANVAGAVLTLPADPTYSTARYALDVEVFQQTATAVLVGGLLAVCFGTPATMTDPTVTPSTAYVLKSTLAVGAPGSIKWTGQFSVADPANFVARDRASVVVGA